MSDSAVALPAYNVTGDQAALQVKMKAVDNGDGTFSLATSAGESGVQFDSMVGLQTTDGEIPVGALSWSILAVSGTVTVNGDALAVGTGLSGGGYGARGTLASAISYTITGGSAWVVYDVVD